MSDQIIPPQPEATSSMWLNMLGLGPVMAQLNDPGFQGQIAAFAQAQFETKQRCERIERMLLLICAHEGIQLNGMVGEFGQAVATTVPTEPGTAGNGTRAIAAIAGDNGTGGTAPAGSAAGI